MANNEKRLIVTMLCIFIPAILLMICLKWPVMPHWLLYGSAILLVVGIVMGLVMIYQNRKRIGPRWMLPFVLVIFTIPMLIFLLLLSTG